MFLHGEKSIKEDIELLLKVLLLQYRIAFISRLQWNKIHWRISSKTFFIIGIIFSSRKRKYVHMISMILDTQCTVLHLSIFTLKLFTSICSKCTSVLYIIVYSINRKAYIIKEQSQSRWIFRKHVKGTFSMKKTLLQGSIMIPSSFIIIITY